MARRVGRPRKADAKRHPNGSVVRQIWASGTDAMVSLASWLSLSDKTRAQMRDPRDGTVAGRLEKSGKITKLERLAGERLAGIAERYRVHCSLAPNPNPPAADLLKSTGKGNSSSEITPEELRCSKEAAAALAKVLRAFKDMKNGSIAQDRIKTIFILDRPVADGDLPLVKQGLRRLQVEVGLTGPDSLA
jgi:hypothetical protein